MSTCNGVTILYLHHPSFLITKLLSVEGNWLTLLDLIEVELRLELALLRLLQLLRDALDRTLLGRTVLELRQVDPIRPGGPCTPA